MQPYVEDIPTSARQSFAWRRFKPRRFPFQWHLHPEAELTLIVKGHGQRYVGDDMAEFGPGDLVLIGPGLAHTWCSAADQRGEAESVVIQFLPACFGEGFFDRPETRALGRLLGRSAVGLAFSGRVADDVGAAMCAMARQPPLRRMMRLIEVLDRLSRARGVHRLASRPTTGRLREADRRRIDRVCRAIDQRYTEPLTLATGASLAGLHPASFARFFKRMTGQTFVEHVNRLRVAHACRLLVETDRPVTDICFASGFGNVSNFNRVFRQLKQMTPRGYRRGFAQHEV